MTAQMLILSAPWAENLRQDQRHYQAQLRVEVRGWEEDLAGSIQTAAKQQGFHVQNNSVVIVDISMYLPVKRIRCDPVQYLPSLLAAVEAAFSLPTGQLVPFIRTVSRVDDLEDAGFTVRLYQACFSGHGMTGSIKTQAHRSIIILDRSLSPDWDGTKVSLNIGVIEKTTGGNHERG